MVGIVHVNLRYRCPDWQRKYSSKVNPYLQVGFVLFLPILGTKKSAHRALPYVIIMDYLIVIRANLRLPTWNT